MAYGVENIETIGKTERVYPKDGKVRSSWIDGHNVMEISRYSKNMSRHGCGEKNDRLPLTVSLAEPLARN